MNGAPLYIAETCPSQIRGTLISIKELFIVLGILVIFQKILCFVFTFLVVTSRAKTIFFAVVLFCGKLPN